MSFKLLFITTLVAIALAAGLLGYRLFIKDPVMLEDDSGLTAEVTTSSAPTPEAIEYTRLLKVIGTIKSLDRSIFTSASFHSLFLFNFPIPLPAPNRSNPFAPIGLP